MASPFKQLFASKNGEMQYMFSPSRFVQPYFLYHQMNKTLPKKICFREIDKEKLFDALVSKYSIKTEDIIESKAYNVESKNFDFYSALLPLSDDLWIYFSHGEEGLPSVEILYSAISNQKTIEELSNLIISFYVAEPAKNKLYLLQHSDIEGFHLNWFSLNEINIDFNLHYNDNFLPVHNIILEGLQKENEKGLVLLHGIPGTGKTSYIRYLTSVIKKRMVYLSPDMAQEISTPRFLSVISEYPNSILIIEDAENVIEERKSGPSSAMSNLLNLSDGLLSDCLKMQIICTFNVDISRIDKALMRKGRLLAKYEFKPLAAEKSQRLSNHLGYKTTINKEMTLAEIFNQGDMEFDEERRKIGFVKDRGDR